MPVQTSFTANDGFGGSSSAGSNYGAPADDGYGSPQANPVSNGYVYTFRYKIFIHKYCISVVEFFFVGLIAIIKQLKSYQLRKPNFVQCTVHSFATFRRRCPFSLTNFSKVGGRGGY